jgi:hypothetical protein
MTTQNDWRALCIDLADSAREGHVYGIEDALAAIDAALAQPELQEMTDQDLLKIYCDARREFYFKHAAGDSDKEDRRAATIYGLHIVLARWGRPAIEPVPVAERPWEREGWCDAEGRCWWGDPEGMPSWWYCYEEDICDATHCLPHWALPVPQQEPGP